MRMRLLLHGAPVLLAVVLPTASPPVVADSPQLRDPTHGRAFRESLLDAWTLTHADEHIDHSDRELERFLFGDGSSDYARSSKPERPLDPVRPVRAKPAKQVPAKQVPAKQVPAKQVPAKQVPAKQVPAKQVPAKQVPASPPPAYEETEHDAKAETKPWPTAPRPTGRRLPLWQIIRAAASFGSDTSKSAFSLCARMTAYVWARVVVPLTKWCVNLAWSTAYATFTLTRAVVLEILRPVRVLVAAPIIYLFLGFYLVFIRAPYRLFCALAREGYPIYLFLAAGGMAGLALGVGGAITLLAGTAMISSGSQELVLEKQPPPEPSSAGTPPSPSSPLPHAANEAARLASTDKRLSSAWRPTYPAHQPEISESSPLDESDSLRTSEQASSSASSEVELVRVPMGDGTEHLRRAASYTQMRPSGWDDVVRQAEKALRGPNVQSYSHMVNQGGSSLRRDSLPQPASPAHARLHEWRLDTARAHAQAHS